MNMKKQYITPSIEAIEINAVNIIASSDIIIDGNKETDTSVDGGQLGREVETPSRPNIWEQGW